MADHLLLAAQNALQGKGAEGLEVQILHGELCAHIAAGLSGVKGVGPVADRAAQHIQGLRSRADGTHQYGAPEPGAAGAIVQGHGGIAGLAEGLARHQAHLHILRLRGEDLQLGALREHQAAAPDLGGHIAAGNGDSVALTELGLTGELRGDTAAGEIGKTLSHRGGDGGGLSLRGGLIEPAQMPPGEKHGQGCDDGDGGDHQDVIKGFLFQFHFLLSGAIEKAPKAGT